MKTITIGTKAQANRIRVNSLFTPVNGRTLVSARYDMGKYKADKNFIGREIDVADHVHALWMESRRDSDGPYKALFCMIDRQD